jgi:hypothetical protein
LIDWMGFNATFSSISAISWRSEGLKTGPNYYILNRYIIHYIWLFILLEKEKDFPQIDIIVS